MERGLAEKDPDTVFFDCSRGSVVTIQAFCREAAGDVEDLRAIDTPSLNCWALDSCNLPHPVTGVGLPHSWIHFMNETSCEKKCNAMLMWESI